MRSKYVTKTSVLQLRCTKCMDKFLKGYRYTQRTLVIVKRQESNTYVYIRCGTHPAQFWKSWPPPPYPFSRCNHDFFFTTRHRPETALRPALNNICVAAPIASQSHLRRQELHRQSATWE